MTINVETSAKRFIASVIDPGWSQHRRSGSGLRREVDESSILIDMT